MRANYQPTHSTLEESWENFGTKQKMVLAAILLKWHILSTLFCTEDSDSET